MLVFEVGNGQANVDLVQSNSQNSSNQNQISESTKKNNAGPIANNKVTLHSPSKLSPSNESNSTSQNNKIVNKETISKAPQLSGINSSSQEQKGENSNNIQSSSKVNVSSLPKNQLDSTINKNNYKSGNLSQTNSSKNSISINTKVSSHKNSLNSSVEQSVENDPKQIYKNGHWYLEQSDKYLTGFQKINDQNKTVYYDPQNGQMLYGQQYINSHWYLFENGTVAMLWISRIKFIWR